MNTYKFEGKKGRMYEYDKESIKQNSNCPASEKSGTGPGSCGGKGAGDTYSKAGFKHTDFDNSDNRISEIQDNVEEAFSIKDVPDNKLSEHGKKVSGEIDKVRSQIKKLEYGAGPNRKEAIFTKSVQLEKLTQIQDAIEKKLKSK